MRKTPTKSTSDASTTDVPRPDGSGWLSTPLEWAAAAALFLFTLLLYWPSYHAGYIWDDRLLVENSLVRGGWMGLRDIWTTTKFPDFCPVTATSFWLESQLGAENPAFRHFTNIILQGGNVVLVWLVLRSLRLPGAWVAAAVFAAHPLAVTSVTWIAERKNTLSMLFYWLSLLFFLKSKQLRSATYWLSFVCFLFALLSKSSTVVLPVVFLICIWWRSGNLSRADILRTLPFFAFALAAGITTLVAHYFFGPKDATGDGIFVRVLAGTKAFWFYAVKTVVPANLTMHYPRWEIDPGSFLSYLPVIALAALVFCAWKFRHGWGRVCLFGLAYYLVALGPTLGIFKMTFLKFSHVADHFQFLALPGLIALFVAAMMNLIPGRMSPVVRGAAIFIAIVPLLAVLSWQHQRIVGDAEALWSDNLKKNPQSWLAHNCVAAPLQARGRFEEAEGHYRKAIAMRPDYVDALSNLGVLLGRMERWTESIEMHRKAAAFAPRLAAVHFNLGTAFFSDGQFSQAVESLAKAIDLDKSNSRYRNNIASALMQLRKDKGAESHLREAIQLDPTNAEAQSNLGLALSRQGRITEAREQYHSALRFNAANISAHHNLGLLLAAENKYEEALGHFAAMAKLQPDSIPAQIALADVLMKQGKTQQATVHRAAASFLHGRELVNRNKINEAKEHYRSALDANSPATIEFAARICDPSRPNSLAHLDLLAATCAETKRFGATTNVLLKVMALGEATGRQDAVNESRRRLEYFARLAAPSQ